MVKKIMTLEKFKKTLMHKEKNIFVPSLNSNIDKIQFIKDGKYSFEAQEEMIKYAYKLYVEKNNLTLKK